MTSLDLNRPSNPVAALPPEQTKSPSRVGRSLLAGFLSLLVSGLGQLFNRQPRKAATFAVISALYPVLLFKTHLLTSYPGLVTVLAIGFAWRIFVIADAAYVAASTKRTESTPPPSKILYPVLGTVLVVMAVFPLFGSDFKKASGLTAFKISSNSMCPTFCTGDRVISDSHAFQSSPPQRGDLIVFLFRPGVVYTKRVIGIAGDVVAHGPDGTILVNGAEFNPPAGCGESQSAAPSNAPSNAPIDGSKLEIRSDFVSTVVPANSFFVIGDNLNSSFDSRVPGFGPVTTATVLGKPIFIYWSPVKARRGCQLQ
jgi:signal peptidase I